MKYKDVYLIVNGLEIIMPELPRPPHNTPPWVWVAACVLVAFTTTATPILLPRLLDGSSQVNTAQNVPVPEASSAPSPTPPIEYKGDPVGEMPFQSNAATIEHITTILTSPKNGKIQICFVESR